MLCESIHSVFYSTFSFLILSFTQFFLTDPDTELCLVFTKSAILNFSDGLRVDVIDSFMNTIKRTTRKISKEYSRECFSQKNLIYIEMVSKKNFHKAIIY